MVPDTGGVEGCDAELRAELAALRARVAELNGERSIRYLETVQRINATLRSTQSLQEVLDTIARGTGEALGYPAVLILLPDDSGERLHTRAIWGRELEELARNLLNLDVPQLSLPLTLIDNPVAHAFLSGEIEIWSGSPTRIIAGVEPPIPARYALLAQQQMGFHLAIHVPLCIGDRPLGVLLAFSPRGSLNGAERDMLIGLAGQAALAIETFRRFNETEHLKSFSENIVQSMAEGIAVEDEAGRLIFLNAAALSMLNYSLEEVLGRDRSLIFPPDQLDILSAADERRIRGESDRYQIDLLCKDGTRLPILVSGSPRFDPSGRFAGILAVFSDITGRLQAEEAMARRAREMSALYETAIATSAVLDSQVLLTRVYDQLERMFDPDAALLGLYDANAEEIRLVLAMEGGRLGYHRSHAGLPVDEAGLLGWLVRSGHSLLVGDLGREPLPVKPRLMGQPPRSWMGAPLISRERIVGAISLQCLRPYAFDHDHLRLLESLARQVAIALDNAQLYEQAQQRLKALTVLFDASAAVSTLLDPDKVLDTTARTLTSALGAEGCAISSWDREQGNLVTLFDFPSDVNGIVDVPGTTYHLADYPASLNVLLTRQPLQVQVDDPAADAAEVALMRAQGMQSILIIPLIVHDEVTGMVELVEYAGSRVYGPSEIGLCQTLANQMAAALENARLFQAERQQRALAEALRRATAAVSSTLDLDQVLDRILEQVSGVFGGDASNIMLIENGMARFVRWLGYDRFAPDEQTRGITLPVEGIPTFRRMYDTGRPLVIPDTSAEPEWVRISQTAWVRSHAGAPIRVRNRVIGFLMVDSATPGFFDRSQAEALQAFADSASIAIANARLYAETVRRNRELALLNRVIAASAASQSVGPILDMVCRELALALGLSRAAAVLLDEERARLFIVQVPPAADSARQPSASPSPPSDWTYLAEAQPLMKWVAEHRAPVLISEPQTDERLEHINSLFRTGQVSVLLVLPLVLYGRSIGAIGLASPQPREFAQEEIELAWRVTSQAASALARARLAEAQQRLSIAVEQAAESVVITDPAGKILYVNPAFEHISGYRRAEAIGLTPAILKSGKQDAAFYAQLWQTLKADQVWQGQFVNKKKDGSLFTETATISPVRDQAGQVVNYVAVKRDVTREVQLEEQFRQTQKMEAMGRLAGGIAHDFNNLLTVIQVSTWLLQRQIRPEDPLRESVDRIQDTVGRATNLIKQLLSFSRRQIIEPQTLNLNQVVGDMGRMLQRVIGEDVHLETSLAPELRPVRVDPSQMEQVIMNLVINARDAMPNGGTLKIETANVLLDEAYVADHIGAHPGKHVLLSISDTGVGISDEVRLHLFEPFFTTKAQGQGTGLGLSTVFGIVKQSRGHVWVISSPGQGTSFQIYLPQAGGAEPETPPNPIPLLAEAHGTETILVVEDEDAVRDLIVPVLTAHGYHVLSSKHGVDALTLSENHSGPIHLLLADVIMPNLNGHEVAERMLRRRPGLRVLYMSGYADDAMVQQGLLAPNMGLLQKPFTLDVLLDRVRAVLDAQ